MESSTLTNQTKTSDTPEPTPTPPKRKAGVFLMRGKGQSFEEFQSACVEAFRKAGLIKD